MINVANDFIDLVIFDQKGSATKKIRLFFSSLSPSRTSEPSQIVVLKWIFAYYSSLIKDTQTIFIVWSVIALHHYYLVKTGYLIIKISIKESAVSLVPVISFRFERLAIPLLYSNVQ